jgi:hypothetical protein
VTDSREAAQIAALKRLMDQTRTMTRLGLDDDALTLNFAQITGALREGGEDWDVSHGVTPQEGPMVRYANDFLALRRGEITAADLLIRSGFDPGVAEAIAAVTTAKPVCPECQQGKHGNCDGTAWDEGRDEISLCRCEDPMHRPEVPDAPV